MVVLFVQKITCLMSSCVCSVYLVSVDDTFYFVRCGFADDFVSLVVDSGSISKIVFHARGKYLVSRFKDKFYVEL